MIGLVLILAVLLLPATADGAITVAYSNAGGVKLGATAETDLVAITLLESPRRYQISSNTQVSAASGCALAAPSVAVCQVTGSTDVTGVLGGGNDRITPSGSVGDMEINGEAGDDNLRGGLGSDVLYGGAGDDTIRGIYADDELHGGPDDDVFIGDGAGTNTIRGDDGNDTFRALRYSVFPDSFDGGTGRDTADYSIRQIDLWLTASGLGPSSGAISPTGATLEGDEFVRIETVVGGAGNDILDALIEEGDPSFSLIGNAGDDDLRITSIAIDGRAYLDGGPDADDFSIGGRGTYLAVTRDGEADIAFRCGIGTEMITADAADAPIMEADCGPVDFGQ